MNRLAEKNKLVSLLSTLKTKIDRARKSTEELRHTTLIKDREYKETQIQTNEDVISKCTNEIDTIEQRLRSLEKGELDDEIQREIDKNMKIVEKKQEITRRKEEEKAKQDLLHKKEADQFNEKNRSLDYQKRQLKFEMQKAYERFCTADIPPYITENLKSMPCNKGYIWKNVWYFGEKPHAFDRYGKAEPVVMFERQRDTMFIHEITENEHYTYKKVGQQPREYVSGITRNSKFKYRR
jgi:hypothetical protein